MGKVLVTDTYLEDIADAIREKLGVETTYKPSEMAAAILSISGGGAITLKGIPNTTVTYTGDASGSVSLDASGEASVVLSGGTYTFTNTVTIGDDTITAYTKTVAVTGDATVKLYPEGMIYWFGRMLTSIADGDDYTGPSGNNWGSILSMTGEAHSVDGSAMSELSNKKECMKWGSYDKVDTTGYSVLKARAIIEWTTTASSSIPYKNNVFQFMSSKSLLTSVKSVDIGYDSSDGSAAFELMTLPETPGEYYIGGYAGYNYKASYGISMKILALWLE